MLCGSVGHLAKRALNLQAAKVGLKVADFETEQA
jgi:hypothetical protein